MKTKSTKTKSNSWNTSKVFIIAMLISFSFKGSAQCTALFTPFDSVGYGYFWNQSSGSGLTCTWNYGDGSIVTTSGVYDVTHLYASPGIYAVCLTVSDSLGTCTASYCDTITIGPGSSGMCMGVVNSSYTEYESSGTAFFNNLPSGSSPVYFWDFGDGTNSSIVGNTSHTYTSNGTYLVCLTVYETGGGTDSCQYCSYVSITGIAPAPCDASFTFVQDSTNLYNYFVYSTASTGSSYTYFWDFGDGSSSTLEYPTHVYSGMGPYILCLTVSNGFLGCTATHCDSLIAGMAMQSVLSINVINPLGIHEEANTISSLENYPNPFNNATTISYTITQDANVELNIMDLLGNKVANIEHDAKAKGSYSTDWNGTNISEGMYLLQLKVNNNVSTKKIIITR